MRIHLTRTLTLLLAVGILLSGCSQEGPVGELTSPEVVTLDGTIGFNALLAPPVLNLPTHAVEATYAHPGANSYFDTTLLGVGDGYDITDGTYPGWCVEDNYQDNSPDPVILYSSYDPALPGNLATRPWDKFNYLLNHKQGTPDDVEAAIWMLMWSGSYSLPETPTAQAMVDDAEANGAGYVPGPGEILAIILYTGDGGFGSQGWQDTVIEIVLPDEEPPGDLEACTPGYWKNHLEDWAATGYSPDDDFATVFGVDYLPEGTTLNDAIRMGGGQEKKLARHGTAALLNAAYSGVDYPYSIAEVIQKVQDFEADLLADTNDELDCPL